jgi:hypothetical protein
MSAQPDESPARQGLRRLQVLAELEGRGGAIIPLAELERLRAIEQRAREIRDFPLQVPYPHPDWSRATDEAAVARQILEGD